MDAVTPGPYDFAKNWVTPDLRRIFRDEIANERNGGVSPSTLTSTIDSLTQMTPELHDNYAVTRPVSDALVALLAIRDVLPPQTEIRDLL